MMTSAGKGISQNNSTAFCPYHVQNLEEKYRNSCEKENGKVV
jgi:hypothetical protein